MHFLSSLCQRPSAAVDKILLFGDCTQPTIYAIKDELSGGTVDWLFILCTLNTSYLTDSYISFTLKLESLFCPNMLIRSSTYGKKNISDFPPCRSHFLLIHFTGENHKFSNKNNMEENQKYFFYHMYLT